MKQEYIVEPLEIDTLGYYLDRALNVMVRLLNKTFAEKDIDLQHAQYTVLKVLWCREGVSQSRLSRLLGKDPAAISRALNYLESKGYIERRGTNCKTNGIFLTQHANSRKEEIESVADLVTDKATSGMSRDQKDLLTHLLNKIYDNIK